MHLQCRNQCVPHKVDLVATVVASEAVSFQSDSRDLLSRYVLLKIQVWVASVAVSFEFGCEVLLSRCVLRKLQVLVATVVASEAVFQLAVWVVRFFLITKWEYIFLITFRVRQFFSHGVSFSFFVDISSK